MKKRNRILSFLLTITLLAGNFESFAMTAYASDDVYEDGDVTIVEDAMNSADDADDDDSVSDDRSDEHDEDVDVRDDDDTDDDADSSDPDTAQNADDEDVGSAGDNDADDEDAGSASDNDADDEDPSDDVTDPDDADHNDDDADPEDSVSDNESSVSENETPDDSVSDNSVSDNSVSDNSVSDNSISENSVSENVITEDALLTGPGYTVKMSISSPEDQAHFIHVTPTGGSDEISNGQKTTSLSFQCTETQVDFEIEDSFSIEYWGIEVSYPTQESGGKSSYSYWTSANPEGWKAWVSFGGSSSRPQPADGAEITVTVKALPTVVKGYDVTDSGNPVLIFTAGDFSTATAITQEYHKNNQGGHVNNDCPIRWEMVGDYECGEWGWTFDDDDTYETYLANVTCALNGHKLTFTKNSYSDRIKFVSEGKAGSELILADNVALYLDSYNGASCMDLDTLIMGNGSKLVADGMDDESIPIVATICNLQGQNASVIMKNNAIVKLTGNVDLGTIDMKNFSRGTTKRQSKLIISGDGSIRVATIKMADNTIIHMDKSNMTVTDLTIGKSNEISGEGSIQISNQLAVGTKNTLTLGTPDQTGTLYMNIEEVAGTLSALKLYHAGFYLDDSLNISGATFTITGDGGYFEADELTTNTSTMLVVGESGSTAELSAWIGRLSSKMGSLDVRGQSLVEFDDGSSEINRVTVDGFTVTDANGEKEWRGGCLSVRKEEELAQKTDLKINILNVNGGGSVNVGYVSYAKDPDGNITFDEVTGLPTYKGHLEGSITVTTLNMYEGSNLSVAYESQFNCTGLATLQSGIEVRNRGTVDFTNVKLKDNGNSDDVLFWTEDPQGENKDAVWYIRGTLTRTAAGDINRIRMRHAVSLEQKDYEQKFRGYDLNADLLYSVNPLNVEFFCSDRSTVGNPIDFDLYFAEPDPNGENMYTLKIQALTLWRFSRADGKDLSDDTVYNTETIVNDQTALVASALDLDSLINAIAADDEAKKPNTVYYIPLFGGAGTDANELTIPNGIGGLIIEGTGEELSEFGVGKGITTTSPLLLKNVDISGNDPILNADGVLELNDVMSSGALETINAGDLTVQDCYLEVHCVMAANSFTAKGENILTVQDMRVKTKLPEETMNLIFIEGDAELYIDIEAMQDPDTGNWTRGSLKAGDVTIANRTRDEYGDIIAPNALVITGKDPEHVSVELGNVSVGEDAEFSVCEVKGIRLASLTAEQRSGFYVKNIYENGFLINGALTIKDGARALIDQAGKFTVTGKTTVTGDGTIRFILTEAELADLDLNAPTEKENGNFKTIEAASMLEAYTGSPVTVSGNLTMGPMAEVTALNGMTVQGTLTMYDSASIFAARVLEVNAGLNADGIVFGATTDNLPADRYSTCMLNPTIRTAPGTDLIVHKNIRSEMGPVETSEDKIYPMHLCLVRTQRTYTSDSFTDVTVGYEANEDILELYDHVGDPDSSDRQILFVPTPVPGKSFEDDLDNYDYLSAKDGNNTDYYALRIVGVQVFAAPADAPEYDDPWECGAERIADFSTYEDAVAYVKSVGVASQKYFIVIGKDTEVRSGLLDIPAVGSQIVIVGAMEENQTEPYELNLDGGQLKQKLNNNVMFRNINIKFSEGTQIDLNGKTLIIFDSQAAGLAGIGSKGALVLYSEAWYPADLPGLSVKGAVSVTTLDMTNYALNAGSLSVTGDAHLFHSELVGLSGKNNKISGNLYMDYASYIRLRDTEGGAFTVGKDLYLRNGSMIDVMHDEDPGVSSNNTDVEEDIVRLKQSGVNTSLVANGNTVMADSAIFVTRSITLKNLYTCSGHNAILYGDNEKDLFKITGTTAEMLIDRCWYSTKLGQYHKKIDWKWTTRCESIPSGVTQELRIALSQDPTQTTTLLVGNAVSVRRLDREPADFASLDLSQIDALQTIAKGYPERSEGGKSYNTTPIVTTSASPKYFRVGTWKLGNEEYTAVGLVSRNKALYPDTDAIDNHVVLYAESFVSTKDYYLSDELGFAGEYGEELIGGYATLQEALSAIKALNRKTKDYAIVVRNADGITSTEANWALPAAQSVRIENATGNPSAELCFKNDLTLAGMLHIEGFKIRAASAVTINLKGYELSFLDCDFSELNDGAAAVRTEGQAYIKSVTGDGTAKGSGFTVAYTGKDDCSKSLYIYGDVKNVGLLVLSNVTLYVTGSVTAGTVEAMDSMRLGAQVAETDPLNDDGTLKDAPRYCAYTEVTFTDTESKLVVSATQKDGVITPNLTVTSWISGDEISYESIEDKQRIGVQHRISVDSEMYTNTSCEFTCFGYEDTNDGTVGLGYRLTDENGDPVPEGATVTTTAKISLALMTLNDAKEEFVDLVPTPVQLASGVPVLKGGVAGDDVYFSASMNASFSPYGLGASDQLSDYKGMFIRRTIGKDKYLCFTDGTEAIYRLSVVDDGNNITELIGSNDWATIVAEIDSLKMKADYIVTLTDTDDDGVINDLSEGSKTAAETLTMPKAASYESLRIRTVAKDENGNEVDYNDGEELPVWNYVGDKLTLNGDTIFENVRLAGYKDAVILDEWGNIDTSKALTVSNTKLNKPTLTIAIGGAYTFAVSETMLVDGRQLMVDGGNKGTLFIKNDSHLIADGSDAACYCGQGEPVARISGSLTKLAMLSFDGGKFMLSGYRKNASDAKLTAGALQVTKLYLLGNKERADDEDTWLNAYGCAVTVTDLLVAEGARLTANTLSVTNLNNPVQDPENVKYSIIEAVGTAEIKSSMLVSSDYLLLRTTQKSATASNLKINPVISNVSGTRAHTVKVALYPADPEEFTGYDLISGTSEKFALVTAAKATADQFVVYTNDAPSVYDKENADGYLTVKNSGVIYAYPGEVIQVAVLRADPAAEGAGFPDSSKYYTRSGNETDGYSYKVEETALLGYYPTYAEAVAAIADEKKPQQGYAIVLLNDVDLGNKGIMAPANAAFVHIYGLDHASLSYGAASTFATNVYLENVELQNNDISVKSKGFNGQAITVNGAYTLGMKDVDSELRAAENGTEFNHVIGQITAKSGNLILEDIREFEAYGDVNVSGLTLTGSGTEFGSGIDTYVLGKLNVTTLLTMKNAFLKGYSTVSLKDVEIRNDNCTICSGRLKGDISALTISGKVRGTSAAEKLKLGLEPYYYPSLAAAIADAPVDYSEDKDSSEGNDYLLTRTMDKNGNPATKQLLPTDKLLFTAPNVEEGQIDPDGSDTLIKASNGFYMTNDSDILDNTVQMTTAAGTSTYLDLNQAVQRINTIADVDAMYTITMGERIADTNVTDTTVTSAFPAPSKDKAAGVRYQSGAAATDLYYSGKIEFYAGGVNNNKNGDITLRNLVMHPWTATAFCETDGKESVGQTVKISRNTKSKGYPGLVLIETTVATPWKSISGTAGVTTLMIDRPMMITEGFSNFYSVILGDSKGTGEAYLTTKNSGIGVLELRTVNFVSLGATTVTETFTNGDGSTLYTTFTEKNGVKTSNFTVIGEINTSYSNDGLHVVPMRAAVSEMTVVNGRSKTVTTAITADNYDDPNRFIVGVTSTMPDADKMAVFRDVPLLNAKQGDPSVIHVNWEGDQPDQAVVTKDAAGVIRVMDSSQMQLHILRTRGVDYGTLKTWATTDVYAKNWADAVAIIDNFAVPAEYTVELIATGDNAGYFPMGKNGTVAAALWPKAANASGLTILPAATNTEDAALCYTGALNPACSVAFEDLVLQEYKTKDTLNAANGINLTNDVKVTFCDVTTQDYNALYFKTITAKKGGLIFENADEDPELWCGGAVNAAMMKLDGFSLCNILEAKDPTKPAPIADWNLETYKGNAAITITNLLVDGDAVIRGKGKITLGTVTGTGAAPEYLGTNPGEIVHADYTASLTLDDYYTAAAPAKSVTQLSITGRTFNVGIVVEPYLVADDKGKSYARMTTEDVSEYGDILYSGNGKPTASEKILTAPYVNTGDVTVTAVKEQGTEEYNGYTQENIWLTKYEGGVYLTLGDPVVCVTDLPGTAGNAGAATVFTDWEQAVKEVNRNAQSGHQYFMYLMDDVGVEWGTDVYSHGIPVGRNIDAVAKSLVLPAVKTAYVCIRSFYDSEGGANACSFFFSGNNVKIDGNIEIADVGINCIKVTRKNGVSVETPQDLNISLSAGANLTVMHLWTNYGGNFNNITGTPTSSLSLQSSMYIKGSIKSFAKLSVGLIEYDPTDFRVAGDVSVTDLDLTRAELHAANITVSGKTTLSDGSEIYGTGSQYLYHSVLAADSSTAVGKGALTLNNVVSKGDNNLVSKQNAKGATQLTIKGAVTIDDNWHRLHLAQLYANGNSTYAVFYQGQILVTTVKADQAQAVLEAIDFTYKDNLRNGEEPWRGNKLKRCWGPVFDGKNIVYDEVGL